MKNDTNFKMSPIVTTSPEKIFHRVMNNKVLDDTIKRQTENTNLSEQNILISFQEATEFKGSEGRAEVDRKLLSNRTYNENNITKQKAIEEFQSIIDSASNKRGDEIIEEYNQLVGSCKKDVNSPKNVEDNGNVSPLKVFDDIDHSLNKLYENLINDEYSPKNRKSGSTKKNK